MSGSITFENILPTRLLEWLVISVGCQIKGINELEVRESKFKWLGGDHKIVWIELSNQLTFHVLKLAN